MKLSVARSAPDRLRSTPTQTRPATTAPAAGHGRPWKYRLSVTPIWMLNRARRSAVAAVKQNPASQPTLPNESSDQTATSTIGAIPNATMSDRLSYSAPNALSVPVMRAIRPSARSNTIATKIAIAPASNRPWKAKKTAKKPLSSAAVVNRLGTRKMPLRRFRSGFMYGSSAMVPRRRPR